eukprot:gene2425-3155_t
MAETDVAPTQPTLSLPSVWRQRSVDVMELAQKQRSNLQEYRSAYWRYNENSRRSQYSMQVQVNESLKKMRATLDLLVEKLSATHQAAIPVEKTLEEMQATLEKDLVEKQRLLDRNKERLDIRAQRPPQELVADEAQRQLLAQEALLKDAIVQEERVSKEVADALAQLQAAQENISVDLADKKTALDLNRKSDAECPNPALKLPDITAKRMDMSQSGTLQLEKDVEISVQKPVDPLLTSPNVWHGATMKNVEKNRRIQTRSLQLCDGCEMLSKKLSEAILQAHHYVAQALQERIKEMKAMVGELKEQLSLTLEEIQEAETTAKMLDMALEDIKEPLKVSTTRREIHKGRPERELIEDDVQINLKSEAGELTEQQAYLEKRKEKVNELLDELVATRDEINQDIHCKEECIALDDKCLQLGSY